MGVASDRIRHQSQVLDNRYERSVSERVVVGTGEEGDREIKGGSEREERERQTYMYMYVLMYIAKSQRSVSLFRKIERKRWRK